MQWLALLGKSDDAPSTHPLPEPLFTTADGSWLNVVSLKQINA